MSHFSGLMVLTVSYMDWLLVAIYSATFSEL